MEVGKKLAFVLSGGNTTVDKELSEDDMYALELETFIQLIQMKKKMVINHQNSQLLSYQEAKLEIKCSKHLKIFLKKRKFWSMEWKLEKN